MAAPTADALAAIEARLQRVLDPYRDRLELATIYGNPALRRAGANAHDWFAFVKPQAKHVGFYLLPIHTDEALRASIPPSLRKRLTGRSAFTFTAIDEPVLAELDALVARAFDRYVRPGADR
ncbi:MAG TPA: hypothetical protein VFQ75_15405 [Candidatus Limnocylindrales bacterium]|nr:hypothetical protein [Candidatus Limnocylindrales bacterium]